MSKHDISSKAMLDLRYIDELRQRGAVEVTFHPTGEVASIRFETTAVPTAPQPKNEDTKSPKRVSAVGGLVPRGIVDTDR